MAADARTTVVVLTHNRAAELARCLGALSALPQRPHVVVVDNASHDGTPALARRFPQFTWVHCPRNLGAAGRNEGVARVRTPYVAFCDDDTCWEPGALPCAADLLDAHARIAAVSARVLVGEEKRLDPACGPMIDSPLDSDGLPGRALIGFMAGASVMRCSAYREVGGYDPRLFLGAEEALMSLDLATRGWAMVYADDVVTRHWPSRARDPSARRVAVLRNRLWIAWLRLPWRIAWYETRRALRDADAAQALRGIAQALAGMPWVLRERRPVPASVWRMWWQVHGRVGSAQARSGSRACDVGRPSKSSHWWFS